MRRHRRLSVALAIAGLLSVAGGATAGGGAASAAGQPATWNFAQARIPGAQAPGRYGSGTTVAVVDTWIDFHHADFGGRIVDEADCVGGNGSCRDHTYAPDACVHGTHVAGTVGSATFGVAPAVHILAVQVLGYDPASGECSGSTADVAGGIRFAVAHHAQVINMSLGDLVPGVFQSSDITAAVHSAAAAGVVVVVAAGNSSVPLTDSYGSDAVLVAATGPDGQLASYSDRNGSVALAAPGGDDGAAGLAACEPSDCIESTEPSGHYGLLEGTSMAAPHVSGTAALLIAESPSRGRADVIRSLESTARPIGGAGSGLLDAQAALSLRRPSAAEAPAGSTPAPATQPAGGTAPVGTAPGGVPAVAKPPAATPSRTLPSRPPATAKPPAKPVRAHQSGTRSAAAGGTAANRARDRGNGIGAWLVLLAIAIVGFVGAGTHRAVRRSPRLSR